MFTYWAMMLSFSGMYVMYITTLGFSKQEISIAVTINTFSALIGQNFIGYFVDKYRHEKNILMACISAGIIISISLMFATLNWQIYLLIFLWGFFIYGTVPLTETWCIENLKRNNEQRNFGKVRGLGSIGYGLSGVAIGLILQNFGWKTYQWYMLVLVCATLIVISIMDSGNKREEAVSTTRVHSEISFKDAFREIVKIKPLTSMVVTVFAYSFVVKGIYSYLGVLVSDFGGGPLSMGFTYFCDATPEVVTFFLSARLLKKFKSKNLIIAAFLLQIVRLTLILVFNSATAVILLGVLSGFAFGMLAAAYKTYIFELAPAKYKASCMSLCETIIGLSGVISAPIFGLIFTYFSINTAIIIGLVIDIVSFLMIMKDSRKERAAA